MLAHLLGGRLCAIVLFVSACTSNPSSVRPEKGRDPASAAGDDPAVGQSDDSASSAPGKAKSNDKLTKPPADVAASVRLTRIYRGLSKPLDLKYFEGDPLARLFVVEQTGTIRAIQDGVVSKSPLLDIRKKISSAHSEQGLLGLAFHPKFKDNRRFYVNYTDKSGATRVVEYTADGEETLRARSASAVDLLQIDQPWRNHNGGGIAFGPDGLLYVGMGDGGAANDPKGAGQNANTLLGKMLRVNVETRKNEVIQSGLRNPWRFAFDRKNGDLYIGDVGQNKWEEIDVVAAKDIDGANFGWAIWEGKHCFQKQGCSGTSMLGPAIEFDHATGCSVTGGVVYRGKQIPSLDGAYFYSDFCTAILRSFRWSDGRVSDHWDWKTALDARFRLAEVSSFAEDAEGEIYLLSLSGSIYKFEATQP